MGRVLVTGAAGFIGSHLVDRLVVSGHEVVGVDCFTDNYPRERKIENLAWAVQAGGFRLVEGDLLDLDLRRLLKGVDGVAHLAGEPGVRASWGPSFARYLERNVRATERLLEATWWEGVSSFVHASSSSVYGPDGGGPVEEDAIKRPASPYGLSKLAAEELVWLYGRERGVLAAILRYFTVYGPRQRSEMALSRFIFLASRGEAVEIFGDGSQVREMTYVSDAVDATVAALMTQPTEVRAYNVGGGARADGWGPRGSGWRGAREAVGGQVWATRARRRPFHLGRPRAGGAGVELRAPGLARERYRGPSPLDAFVAPLRGVGKNTANRDSLRNFGVSLQEPWDVSMKMEEGSSFLGCAGPVGDEFESRNRDSSGGKSQAESKVERQREPRTESSQSRRNPIRDSRLPTYESEAT